MAKKYSKCPDEVTDLAAQIIEKDYPEFNEAGLVIEYQFVSSDSGPALTLGGWPCNAVVKIIGLQDRVAGRGDAIVTIDEGKWEEFTERSRAALLAHELHHLIPQKEDDGNFKTDAHGRPKLKMRPHDVQIGWFKEIAQRYGDDSMEVTQAHAIFDDHGQAFFPWLLELNGGEEKPAKAARTRKAPKAASDQPPAVAA